MGKQYKTLQQKDIDFIKKQKLFYLASCSAKEVNLSPKGYDSIRVLDKQTLLYLDFPGSGNRTYRDAMAGGEFTLVFNAFEGNANIVRLFCKAGLPKLAIVLVLWVFAKNLHPKGISDGQVNPKVNRDYLGVTVEMLSFLLDIRRAICTHYSPSLHGKKPLKMNGNNLTFKH